MRDAMKSATEVEEFIQLCLNESSKKDWNYYYSFNYIYSFINTKQNFPTRNFPLKSMKTRKYLQKELNLNCIL